MWRFLTFQVSKEDNRFVCISVSQKKKGKKDVFALHDINSFIKFYTNDMTLVENPRLHKDDGSRVIIV